MFTAPTIMRANTSHAPDVDVTDLAATERAMHPVLAPAMAAIGLQMTDMRLRKISVDARGNQHLRYDQTHRGLDVVGGDLVIQVDGQGQVCSVHGSARGDFPADPGLSNLDEGAVHALAVGDVRYAGMQTTPPRKVYFVAPDGAVHLAYETVVSGSRSEGPVRDKVFIDADTGMILGRYPQSHFAGPRGTLGATRV